MLLSLSLLLRRVFAVGAINLALAIALGAFGAHGLKSRVAAGLLAPERLETWHTAAQYHAWHSLGLMFIALAVHTGMLPERRWPFWGLGLGILLFSGSLYALVLTGIGILGAITPLGGVCWIVTWLGLGILAWHAHAEAGS